ncbi:MAG: acyl-CoA thioesterase II [Polyangia bacterium]|jgi:acyl-CoA thioesterase-2
MTRVLNELVTLLALEKIEEDLFRGQSQDLGWGQVFGGQVLGQALSAAVQTVASDRNVHSLHAYFLRLGDARKPIVYSVDRVRDGQSFSTRSILAVQSGKPIFQMLASFQVEEQGVDHAEPMTEVVGPQGLLSERELWTKYAERLPEKIRTRATAERPIELRPVDPVHPFAPEKRAPDSAVWVRTAGALPDDPALHRYLLAYCSDFAFLPTALRPHGLTWVSPGMQIASIDHAMWFHRPFRMDDWLLHVMHSPSASGARGMVRGSVFSSDGQLVASTAQEGLIRFRSGRE